MNSLRIMESNISIFITLKYPFWLSSKDDIINFSDISFLISFLLLVIILGKLKFQIIIQHALLLVSFASSISGFHQFPNQPLQNRENLSIIKTLYLKGLKGQRTVHNFKGSNDFLR